jgi:hypothetical protein
MGRIRALLLALTVKMQRKANHQQGYEQAPRHQADNSEAEHNRRAADGKKHRRGDQGNPAGTICFAVLQGWGLGRSMDLYGFTLIASAQTHREPSSVGTLIAW